MRQLFSKVGFVLVVAISLAVLVMPQKAAKAAGASLLFSPSKGDYLVDSTFDVSVLVNTGGNSINAVEAFISFPADKLQVVNPTASKSFIEVWIAGPSYSNTEGKISFQGGLPTPGINTSSGVISTVQFRVKSAGTAALKFLDTSRVLANDGIGTNLLTSKSTANYNLVLAPPEGPKVTSPSHPDQNKWYQRTSIDLAWEAVSQASSYSYTLDNNPTTLPETKEMTDQLQVTLEAKSDGIWYFHIRAKNNSSWGGASHYSIKIDATVPAAFKPKLDKARYSASDRVLARFTTTDATSGLDHYEVKVIDQADTEGTTSFFTEQQSPYQIPQMPIGKYKFVARAYDLAGNYTDGVIEFNISAFGFLSWLPFSNNILIAIIAGFLIPLLLIIAILILIRRNSKRRAANRIREDLVNIQSSIKQKQSELQRLNSLQQASQQALTAPQRSEKSPTEEKSTQSFDAGQDLTT